MGFNLMVNFNRPYFSTNIQEFWAKWHISLSTWFRDYLYISLGGNRVQQWKIYRNVAIVFITSGFWHGANWTFIVWGAIHAFCIVLYMISKPYLPFGNSKLSALFGWLFTFVLVSLAWVFFRAATIEEASAMIWRIVSFDNLLPLKGVKNFGSYSAAVSLVMIAYMFVCEWFNKPLLDNFQKHYKLDLVFISITLFLVVAFGVFQQSSFIYFQF
jgi:D-alanyl-lipoteichoic acid acyltransferase DltB (MBOAT superfamily)